MNREEVKKSVGMQVTVNGSGDLAMEAGMKSLISDKIPLTILKLTRGGMGYVEDEKGDTYVIPPKNLDLVEPNGEDMNYIIVKNEDGKLNTFARSHSYLRVIKEKKDKHKYKAYQIDDNIIKCLNLHEVDKLSVQEATDMLTPMANAIEFWGKS